MANWPGRSWLANAAADSALALVPLVNIFAAQTGLLELALLLRLVHPVTLFLLVLRHFEPPVADAKPCPSGSEFLWHSRSSENADPKLARPMPDFYCGGPLSASHSR